MKIVYLNRARGQFWSIEELFSAVAESLPSTAKVRTQTVPRTGASLASILSNVLASAQIRHADVIHVTGDIHYALIGIWRIPTVLTIHDLRFIENQRGLRRFLFWLLWIYLPCKRATRVTVISQFTKQRLQSLVRVPDNKLCIIPDCVKPEFRASPKPTFAERPVVLHVGTTPNKNLERLTSACSGLDIELWILGRLSEAQKADLMEKRIVYREYCHLERDQVVRLYEQCDIVSFVSLYEGFGLPVLEGQAVGRPVLTSNIAPMNEVSGDGALLVDPLDVQAIRQGLVELLQSQALRTDLVEKGFRNVRKYSVTTVAEQYHDLYKTMVSRSV